MALQVKMSEARELVTKHMRPPYKKADKWDAKKMARVLMGLAQVDDIEKLEIKDEKYAKLFKDVLAEGQKGEEDGEITVVQDAAGEASGNGKEKTKGKKKGEGKKKPEKEKREYNQFGSVVASSNDQVDMVLLNAKGKALSFKDIVDATGLGSKQVRYAHLDKLVADGHAVKTDDGWAIKGGASKPKVKVKARSGK